MRNLFQIDCDSEFELDWNRGPARDLDQEVTGGGAKKLLLPSFMLHACLSGSPLGLAQLVNEKMLRGISFLFSGAIFKTRNGREKDRPRGILLRRGC